MNKVAIAFVVLAVLALSAQTEASRCQGELRGLRSLYARNARSWNNEMTLLKRMMVLTNRLEGVKDMEDAEEADVDMNEDEEEPETDVQEGRRSAHSSAVKRMLRSLMNKIRARMASMRRSISLKSRQCRRECIRAVKKANWTKMRRVRAAGKARASYRAWRTRAMGAGRSCKVIWAKYMALRRQRARDYRVQRMELALLKRLMYWVSKGRTTDLQNKATTAIESSPEVTANHEGEWQQVSDMVTGRSKEWVAMKRILSSLRRKIIREMNRSRSMVARARRTYVKANRWRKRCMISKRVAQISWRSANKRMKRSSTRYASTRRSCRAYVR